MENEVEFRDWSNISTELVEEWCKRLDMEDLLRLGAVCKRWHSSTSNKAHLSTPKIPWLIFDSEESSKFHIFTYTNPCKHYEIYKPFRPFRGSSIAASTKAWLLITSPHKLFILNIFSKLRIDLPPHTTFPSLLNSTRQGRSTPSPSIPNDGRGMNTPLGFVILTCPNLNPISAAAVTRGGDLAWCNLKDNAWKAHRGAVEYRNIAFHDGKLFAVNRDGSKIDMFHVDDNNSSGGALIQVGSINSPNLYTPNMPNLQLDVYLVEFKGSLLILKRYYNNNVLRRTFRFHAFKLEKDSATPRMVALSGDGMFDGHSLFVNNTGLNCECIDPIDCPEFERDCIYFVGQSGDDTSYEFGVYSIANKRVYRVALPNTDRAPVWVMPRVAFHCECPDHDLSLWKPKRSSRKRKLSISIKKE